MSITAAADEPTFKVDSRVVSVFTTVTDAQRRLVPNLDQRDFEVFDNGKTQPLSFFVNETQPITVIAMLDTSASMTGNAKLLERAASEFVGSLLPNDRARVGAFNDIVEFSPRFTNDRDELTNAILDLNHGSGTRLYDALSASLEELQGIPGRRVILIFTDGDDTDSDISLKRVVERARAQEVMVYAIGLAARPDVGNKKVNEKPDAGLKRLADETGGGYFELESKDDLVPTFTRVAQELHSQYVLGFEPAALDGRMHKLEVRIRQAGMTARARRSYVAAGTALKNHGN
jgi:Ca-activated chloride channel family protein